jgi:hypothetical protein
LSAVRFGRWKLFSDGALYDLEADIGETRDVRAQDPETVARLHGYLEEARRDLGDGETKSVQTRRGEGVRPVGVVDDPRPLLPVREYAPPRGS